MKKILGFILCQFLMVFNLSAQWSKTYRSSDGSNLDRANAIQSTPDGGFIVVGYAYPSDGGDIWVLKLNASGDIVWQKRFGGNDVDEGKAVQPTSDRGCLVVGSSFSAGSGICVLKLDSSGKIEWQRGFSGQGASAVRQTTDGGYIVAGGIADYWLLKLSAQGAAEWQKTYGGAKNDILESIQQTQDGGYIVSGNSDSFAGVWVLKLSSTGGIEWQEVFKSNSYQLGSGHILQTLDGGYFLAGSDAFFFMVAKLSSLGAIEWQRSFEIKPEENVRLSALKQSSDGSYILAGNSSLDSFRGSAWVAKIMPTGEIVWQKFYGQLASDHAADIAEAGDGGYLAAGRNEMIAPSGMFGSTLLWLLKLYPSGDLDLICGLNRNKEFSPGARPLTSESTEISPQAIDPSSASINLMSKDVQASITDLCAGTYYLKIGPDETGGTTDPPTGLYKYAPGTVVSVKAVPQSGYKLYWWEVEGTLPATSTYSLTMDSHKAIRAYFIPDLAQIPGLASKCFIATAVYGSDTHPYVKLLRSFRDKFLLTNMPGLTFVRLYYEYSPSVARFISAHKMLRIAGQGALLPIVGLAALALRFGIILTIAVTAMTILLIAGGWKLIRKKLKTRAVGKDAC